MNNSTTTIIFLAAIAMMLSANYVISKQSISNETNSRLLYPQSLTYYEN